MAAARSAVAIDLGRRRLRAVQAGVSRGRLRVRRTLVEEVPADLDPDDAAALGTWAGEALRRADIPRRPATIAIGREHVGLKRITLPTTDPDELADMTRLALQRELPFDADTAVIDFLPLERSDISTTVLAVAVPQKVIDHARQWAAAAGLKVQRIALRTTGCAALLNSIDDARLTGEHAASGAVVRSRDMSRVVVQDMGSDGTPTGEPSPPSAMVAGRSPLATLGIDVVGEGVEFCVVADGSIRFSRAAEVPAPQDQLSMADAVVTEARRTWMSYRAADDGASAAAAGASAGPGAGGAIATAHIMGDRRVAEYAAGPLGQMLRIPVQLMREHPRIDAGEAGAHDMDRLWPLAGMLLEREMDGERIDFLHPRRPPDVGARRRQRRLLAAAAMLIIGGAVFTLLRSDLRRREGEAERLSNQWRAGIKQNARDWRNAYKLEHLRQWDLVHVDWLEHAKFLAQVAPPPEEIVLDSWSGTLESGGVQFDSRQHTWSVDHQTTIVIEGEARNRAKADAFREALTQNTIYTTSTTGADTRGGKRMPFGFTYRLRTRATAPQVQAHQEQAAAQGGMPASGAPRHVAAAPPEGAASASAGHPAPAESGQATAQPAEQ